MTGRVHLVGAGPGDPGLLTLRGKRRLAEADVVVHDDLVPRRLLAFARPGAELIAVGPVHASKGRLGQAAVESLLVERAGAGQVVVRLKNGDPMLFGRGGEEAAALAAAGIPFEIVPGVSSALAVPAYAGIPVTHRAHASVVSIATGHQAGTTDVGEMLPALDWSALAAQGGSLVFLMAVRQLDTVLDRLVAHGLAPEAPTALIRWGTTGRQRTVIATAATLAGIAAAEDVRPPAVLVVGDVVRLRETLAWAEHRPLFGRRIVITRAREQAAELADRLEALGADVEPFPTIHLVPRLDAPEVQRAVSEAGRVDWIVFTSANGVRYFLEALAAASIDVRTLARARIAAIGSETARALRRSLLQPAVVPEDYRAEGLVSALGADVAPGARVLLPRAAGSRAVLPDALRARGAVVDDVALYEAMRPTNVDPAPLRAALGAGQIDALTFTSSSTVRNFLALLGDDAAAVVAAAGCAVACIGPITAATATEAGLGVTLQPDTYTVAALVDALVRHFCTVADDPLSEEAPP